MRRARDRQVTELMRAYWDERARENALWYVDTSLDYDQPDVEAFLEGGRRLVRLAVDEAPVQPPQRTVALEIGSGLGRNCIALRERFDTVIGIDVSEEMIARASSLGDDGGVSYRVGDGRTLAAIETASVDLVLSFIVFQHIPDVEVIESYLEEMGRVLRPGGVAAFQWNNLGGARRWAVRRALVSRIRNLPGAGRHRNRLHPAFLGARVPLDRIAAAVERGGMRLVEVRNQGTLYCFAWAERGPGPQRPGEQRGPGPQRPGEQRGPGPQRPGGREQDR